MALTAYVLALLLLVVGITLRFVMRKYRTEWGKTIHWYQVQYWFMPWKTVDYLTPKGMKIFTTSTACICAGIAFVIIASRL
ncbi:MAG: hypothetical protein WAU88_07160 [Candidatus Zixiibacteriota bacterium]